jgi:hypothetical protein
MSLVKIVTFVPSTHTDKVRTALGSAGAGIQGEYSYCSFTSQGVGGYLPSKAAKPFIGSPGNFEQTPEERIEVTCERGVAKQVIDAMKQAIHTRK